MDEISASTVPLRCGAAVVGFVRPDKSQRGGIRGEFVPGPDFAPYRPLFEQAVEAAHRVDSASEENYLAEWQAWSQSLNPINALGLTFGEPEIPVEDLEIDSDWRVEFSAALWWQVEQELKGRG